LEHPDLNKTNWLPVRMIKYFTILTIVWWCMAGISHGLLIGYHKHNEFVDFTGSNVLPPLAPKFALVQFPAPAKLFKVSALHCSPSGVWVSSEFSTYALLQGKKPNTPGALEQVQDGDVNAVICGTHGCDALSPPEEGRSEWLLTSMNRSNGPAPRKVALPATWKKVSGAWSECPESASASCTVAWLAGWDGETVTAATLQMGESSDDWQVHSQYEVDPAVGLCSGGHAIDCGHTGPRTYDDVSALQMSAGGKSLTVMSGGGVVDVWDLAKGSVTQRLKLGQDYSSMCRSGQTMFLSRQGNKGPIVTSMAVPSSLAETKHSGLPSSAGFLQVNSGEQQQPAESRTDRFLDGLDFLARGDGIPGRKTGRTAAEQSHLDAVE